MFSSIFQSSTLPVLEQVVNFTEARHGVLAGNVANIDTPGYKTRDLSPKLFEEKLKEAVKTSRQPTSSHYMPGVGSTGFTAASNTNNVDAFKDVKEATRSILYHDESDVSMETQITEIAKNQGQHNLAISIMSAQFRLLRAAVTERVA